MIDDLAVKANSVISEWSKDISKLVIAIDGWTGVGKTSLLAQLAVLNRDILPVNRDDFLLSRATVQDLLSKASEKSKVFELEVCDNKEVEKLIVAFRADEKLFHANVFDPISGEVTIPKDFETSKKILVIEGVFMFHPKLLNHLWDKRIYLEGDVVQIDERRVKREKEKWGKDYFPETHPDSYFRLVTIALKRYIELHKPEKIADLVLRVD